MLGKHTSPHTVPGRPAQWLSPGIFCLGLTFLLGWVGLMQGHPQCLDYGPPFRPPLHLEFCSDYDSFGCCDRRKDRRIAARYWDIMNYFDLKGHELCGGYIKDILCQVGLRRGAGCGFRVFERPDPGAECFCQAPPWRAGGKSVPWFSILFPLGFFSRQ